MDISFSDYRFPIKAISMICMPLSMYRVGVRETSLQQQPTSHVPFFSCGALQQLSPEHFCM